MNGLKVIKNPDKKLLETVVIDMKLEASIAEKIYAVNNRVEFKESADQLFLIFHLPEYNSKSKSIESVEVNLLYNLKDNNAVVFASNTEYFFDKYKQQLEAIEFKSLGKFFEEFMSIVIEDEAKMVEHILMDTNDIKQEYFKNSDTYVLIRHLTNNLINISSIELISSNQNKLINLLEEYVSKNQKSILNYKKNYLGEELKYAASFCNTLLESIGTKFQVKSSNDLSRYTKYSFVVFVATLIVALLTLLIGDRTEGSIFFIGAVIASILSTIVIVLVFKSKD
ncbi:MAG: hypothetical protein WCO33_02960 [bacterium]